MSVNIFPDPKKLSKAAAHLFVDIAQRSVQKKGRFTVALSGGGSPELLYKLLASDDFSEKIPWSKTFVFWGDERFVAPDDPENNARMARQTLLNHVPVPDENIFPIPTEGKPKQAVEDYAATLYSFFEEDWPQFDLILLGLGTNGHTASLFPHTGVLNITEKLTGSIYLKEKDQYRITLTAPVLNNARHIVFLAFGAKKAAMVSNIIDGPYKPKKWPAQLIDPTEGTLHWYLDEAAALKID